MDLEDQATIALVVDDSKRESLVTVRDSPDYLKAMGKRSVAQAKETAVAERQSQKGRAGRQLQKRRERTPSRDRDEHSRLRSLPPRPAYVEIDTDNAPLADPNKPRGGAVGADGRLLDASEIDFTEEGEETSLPRPPSRHRRSPPRHHPRSPSPHRHHHSPSRRRYRSPSSHRRRDHSAGERLAPNDDEMVERPAKRARYHASMQNPEAHYSPAKPARKRTRDEDEDFGTLSGGERGLNRNIKKLPHRARHPSQPVSRDSSRHNTRPPLSNSGKVIHSHNRQSDIYHAVRNQAGSSRQLYTINDDEFDDDY